MNWRSLGDAGQSAFVAALTGTPLQSEAASIYAAVKPHSILYLAHLLVESNFGREGIATTTHNPTGLRPRGGAGFLSFDTWTAAAKEWFSRITDPNYAYANTVSVEDYIHTYAPSSDGNNEESYVAAIMATYDQHKGATPVTATDITYGKVPYPDVVESHLEGNPWVEPSGAPDVPIAVVWHRMVGSLLGTDDYFHGGNAATCYGVGCAATDGSGHAGVIYEWIEPRSGRYGESSGPVSQPYGDGAALVDKVGTNSVNRMTKAIEISGEYDTPLDEACIEAVVNMTAYWADQAHIPWDQFPHNPATGFSFVVWHQEITIGSGKICPGPVVMNATPAMIQRVAQRLKEYQVGAIVKPPTIYTPSVLPEWFADSLASVHPSDARFGDMLYRVCRRNEQAKVRTVRRSKPNTKSAPSGPAVEVDEKVFVERQLVGKDKSVYWLTVDGHYVLASKFGPRVRFF